MKFKFFSILVLALTFSALLIAGGCRTKPSTSPISSNPTSTPVVQPTHTPVPVVPTATPTPVVIATISTQAQFNSVVLNSRIPVLVVCGASWCGWCTWMDPYVQQFANDHAGHCLVVKVDCSTGTPAFVNTYGVPCYPTSLFFNHGALARSIAGAIDETGLNNAFAGI